MGMLRIELEVDSGAASPVPVDLRTTAPGLERPVIVVCHGFLGYKRWGFFPYLSERLAAGGFHVFTMSFSMSGVDERTGLFARPAEFAANTVSREIEDLGAVCRFIRDGALPGAIAAGSRGFVGHSRGASVMLLAAGEFPEVRSLVTWSALGRLDRYTERRKKAWRRDGALSFTDPRAEAPLALAYSYYEDIDTHREAFDLPKAAARLAIPLLMIHGDRDAAVTLRETRELLARPREAETRFEIIRGAGHTFNVTHPMAGPPAALERAAGLTEEWFKRTLPVVKEELA
jgi:uncharacterized protein